LIVEVLSPSTEGRDRGRALRAYARAGVPHYWLVDVERRQFEAYRLDGGAYRLTGTHRPAGSFEPELFPGLSIPLASLWLPTPGG
jgi:Uma2 family endonuclease